jgi:DNA-binding IclR family transcriptional regulator
MVDHRLVDRIEPGTYRLGIRLLELGSLVRSRISVRQEALPYMQALHEVLGETVNLSVRHDDEVVYIERTSDSNAMMRVVQIIGARAPLHITAVGKLFLAAESTDRSAEYVRRTGLPRFTENTLTDADNLGKELEKIRRQGYAFDNEEAEKGVSCIGAGIYNDEGRIVAGLSVSAPSDRVTVERPLPADTAQLTRVPRGIELFFPPLRTPGAALGLALFGAACFIAGSFAAILVAPLAQTGPSGAMALWLMSIFIIPFMVFGVVFPLLAVYTIANSLTVIVTESQIR